MNIFFESPQRLKIELSGTDLSELGITYDELDYSSERTRCIVNDLLCRIGADEEFGPSSRRIIEIFPMGEGGCTMYFTTVREGALTARKRIHEVSVWEVENADALMSAADCLKGAQCAIKISLYLYKNRYRLIINEHMKRHFKLLLCEFARKCGEKSAALITAEYGRLLSDDLLRDYV